MSKTSLIIKREYLSRVKKKSFIIMSIIGPLLFGAMIVLPAWFSTMEDTNMKKIAVIDHSKSYASALKNTDYLKFVVITDQDEETFKNDYKSHYDAFLILSNDILSNEGVKIYSDAAITMDLKNHIEWNLKKRLEQDYLDSQNIEGLKNIIDHINSIKVNLTTIKVSEGGEEKKSSSEITMILSIIFALMIYMFVLIYGTQVMRGVMEEKSNRIVEVIISSVKPFQLMMGKIVGIAMVALTQFLIWSILTFAIVGGINAVIGQSFTRNSPSNIGMSAPLNEELQQMEHTSPSEFEKSFNSIMDKIDLNLIIWSLLGFIYFFIGGYLLYAALFAAVGSAIDNDTDSQQFVMPIMMPLILSIYVATAAFRNPGSDVAFWFSMIPFTSPVVMMARIPFNIPLWEILTSMGILAVSFVGFTYIAGRIYRTGILMYGKKVSYKELWKWFVHAGK